MTNIDDTIYSLFSPDFNILVIYQQTIAMTITVIHVHTYNSLSTCF